MPSKEKSSQKIPRPQELEEAHLVAGKSIVLLEVDRDVPVGRLQGAIRAAAGLPANESSVARDPNSTLPRIIFDAPKVKKLPETPDEIFLRAKEGLTRAYEILFRLRRGQKGK